MQPDKAMRLRKLAVGVLLAVLLPLAAMAQTPPTPDPTKPDFSITVEGTFDPETVAEFSRRVEDYVELRSRLEVGLPPLVVTDNADQIERFEHGLAERIDDARGSRRGQVFLPAMEGQLKRMLTLRVDAVTLAAIMDDNPGEFDVDINENYNKKHALATMPPNILLRLPDLPKDMQYRFVGRHLILYDARANVVVDEIPYALRCRDCVPEPEHDGDSDEDAAHAR